MNNVSVEEIKLKMIKSGKKRMYFADKLGLPYNTLSAYLNRYVPMPEHLKEEILKVLEALGDD